MRTIPFAVSISHLVSSAGADVGFAAIVGLAILVLLFFSQARETATLRRRADEAEQQLRELAAYVDQLLRRPAAHTTPAPRTGTVAPVPPPAAARVAARQAAFPAASRPGGVGASPVPAAAAARTSAAVGAATLIPAAPAGVGAPALSAATRLIPLNDPDSISIRSLKNGAGEPAPGSDAPANGAGAATLTPSAPAGPPPSTAAGGANGAGRVSTPSSAAMPADDPGTRAPERREGAAPSRPAGPPTFNDPVPPSRPRLNRLAVIGVAIVAVIVVIVAVVVLLNRGGSTSTNAASTSTAKSSSARAGRRSRHHVVTVTPSAVTVAVLNGTTTTHLAADIMSKLTSAGYKQGANPTNAPEQTLTSTIVGYTAPGFRADALAVAKSLDLGPASVQGVSPGDHAAACHGTTAGCPDQVVVTVGSDLASNATSASTG